MTEPPATVDIDWLQNTYSIMLPKRHRHALLDTSDPIHGVCEFLLLDSPGNIIPIARQNACLRENDIYEWPEYLFAFASHGFGDFYAYDIRSQPYRVYYIDPDLEISENLTPSEGDLCFDSFDAWYDYSTKTFVQRSDKIQDDGER